MKPIDRIQVITDAAAVPVTVLTTNPVGTHPESYTISADQMNRLLSLAADAAWAAAFIERLRTETDEAAAYAKEQRDDTYPVPLDKLADGEEPGKPDTWSQGFHEGAAHVKDMLGQLIYTDPEHFAPTDTAFRTPEPGPPAITRAPVRVLEFDPEPAP